MSERFKGYNERRAEAAAQRRANNSADFNANAPSKL